MDSSRTIDGRRRFLTYPNGPKVVWTKLQVPLGVELDTDHWAGYFQPLLHAEGHKSTVWAKVQGSTDLVILATLWHTTSELRDFMASPSAQLYTESLASIGIIPLVSYETIPKGTIWFRALPRSFTQLFWVYFPAPMTQAQQAQITSLKGMLPPALGFSMPRNLSVQTHIPAQSWATQIEDLHGQKAQLVLWLHLWRDARKAEWRHLSKGNETSMEEFIEDLEKVGAIEWKEDFYEFKTLLRL
ncbi:hypothetical protein C8Q69DRAFT_480289 [Paecilomyces variotii]|uniref:ABM domain-containing protein n=1 Tax=Byssochlamys spectabilis TaxID=264951 RepID=A0A443HK59_BYSSP|nr:hypothetical protein C8Q69DRAFT_480289 [Paecilomyces variotii]KAJ9349789.1 hypothetical protein DTO280E4_8922 [Paecilomyces variotii]RWQ92241.1 hypothetical protein C8Q69DRAFT_480289 [Paecilomyces variotii]